jgi:PBSX family phage portal protein
MSDVVEAPRATQRFHLVGVQKDAFDTAMGQGADADPTQPNMPQPGNAARSVQSNVYEAEDEYQKLYIGGSNSKGLLEPPYMLRMLDRLSQENNALSPCIEAMVVNIDGTGHDFFPDHSDEPDNFEDSQTKELQEFFDEPWPGVSFHTMRQDMRRDLERTGNGYFEFIRNARDDIVFMRHADAKMMRIVKLDEPTVVVKKVKRKGAEVSIKTQIRERRFAQLLNGRTVVFFKEFGASRDLDKNTGMWAAQGVRLPAMSRATEILHFKALPDAHTPYGVPRWIMQVPSILGSRKAEEFNLDFFDNGGVPPILILLQGGSLTTETRKAMENGMNRGAKRANRVQVFEAEPTGGAIDAPSSAKITVERFGHERQNDALFENYDMKCESRVRRAFRLPPIFVGSAESYSFATAYASYTVAEAQVFKPERHTFDRVFSMKVLPAMGYGDYRIRSKPLTISDIGASLNGITLANQTNYIAQSEVIRGVNEVTGLNLKVAPGPVLPWLMNGINPTTGLPDKTALNAAINSGTAATKASQSSSPTAPSPTGKGASKGASKPSNGTPTQTPRAPGNTKPKVTVKKEEDEALGDAASGSFQDEVPEVTADDPRERATEDNNGDIEAVEVNV